MALIFFEGFNRSFTGPDPAGQWTMTSVNGSGNTATAVFGSAAASRTGPQALSLPSLPSAGNTNQCYAELNIESQANKTLFIGFSPQYLFTGNNQGSPPTASPFAATILRLYNAAGTERLRLDVAFNLTNTDAINLTFRSAAGATVLDSFILNNAVDAAAFGITGGRMYGLSSPWPYIELKLVLNSSANGSVELRVEGLALQTSTNAATIALPTIDNISKIRFYGNESYSYHIDDLYIVDSSGSDLNSWLGPKTRVHSPTLENSNTVVTTPVLQEWTAVGSFTPSSHDPDADYITTKTVNKSQYYVFNTNPGNAIDISADEVIGAVMVRSIARETSLPAAYRQVFKTNAATAAVNIGSLVNTNAYYESAATVLMSNPSTNAAWTVANLNSAHFGLLSVARA